MADISCRVETVNGPLDTCVGAVFTMTVYGVVLFSTPISTIDISVKTKLPDLYEKWRQLCAEAGKEIYAYIAKVMEELGCPIDEIKAENVSKLSDLFKSPKG